jgi:hypothetical protein
MILIRLISTNIVPFGYLCSTIYVYCLYKGEVIKLISDHIVMFFAQALVARTYHPPFSNFLFTNLFSIKYLYFFIISSLVPYFNLFVSIFTQSYVNIKLHVSTLLNSISLPSKPFTSPC